MTTPDPNAILHLLCARCDRIIWSRGEYGIPAECGHCTQAASEAWGLGSIQGEASGS